MTLTRLTRLDYWCVLQLLMISPIVPQVWPNLGQCLDQYSIIYHKLHQFNNTYQYNNNHGYITSERILFYLWRFHVLVPVKKMCITSPFLKKKEKKTMLLTTRFFFLFQTCLVLGGHPAALTESRTLFLLWKWIILLNTWITFPFTWMSCLEIDNLLGSILKCKHALNYR